MTHKEIVREATTGNLVFLLILELERLVMRNAVGHSAH